MIPGEFSPYETTGVVGPSLYYIGQYFEIGVMAQVPINRASGDHGRRAQPFSTSFLMMWPRPA